MENEDKFPPVLKHTERYGINRADANLRAAAPELYAALEKIIKRRKDVAHLFPKMDALEKENKEIEALLAKARGEETPSE